jgi:tartrate-resistant acid phosphatase type 5
MTEHHFEPYVHLVDVTHEAALVAWGGFWFRLPSGGSPDQAVIVDDEDLGEVSPGRSETIGARSRPYGEAVVEALDGDGEVVARTATGDANHAWLTGLEPDTAYRFRLQVDGKPWEADVHHDWAQGPDGRMGLRRSDRRYPMRLRTNPHPDTPAPLTFAVLGDFGVGVRKLVGGGERQWAIARALERAVESREVRLVLTTGDNIYLGEHETKGGSGDEDDDWFFTYYQPYRYVIDHVPVYPAAGNHDAEQEASDDRQQLADNFFLEQRFTDEVGGRDVSLDPGLFYRFGYGADIEFVCIDTTSASAHGRRFFDEPRHAAFLEAAFPAADPPPAGRPRWRIPFSHHPAYCAGPKHPGTREMVERLVPLFQRAGVRAVLSGHEHNFQLSVSDGIHYLITGAGGKLSTTPPFRFDEADTRAWAAREHFLLVEVGAGRIVVHPCGGLGPDGEPAELTLLDTAGAKAPSPIVIESGAPAAPRRLG